MRITLILIRTLVRTQSRCLSVSGAQKGYSTFPRYLAGSDIGRMCYSKASSQVIISPSVWLACTPADKKGKKKYFVLNRARYIFFFVINFCFSSTPTCVEKQFLTQSYNLQKAKIAAFEVRVFKIQNHSPQSMYSIAKYNNEHSVGEKKKKKDFRKQLNLRCLLFFFKLQSTLFLFSLISQSRNLIDYKCFVMMSLEPIDFSHLFLDNTRSAGKHQQSFPQ